MKQRLTALQLALMIVFFTMCSCCWSLDMNQTLDNHDPTTDSGAAQATVSQTPVSPAATPPAAGPARTGPSEQTQKDIEGLLKQLEEIVKILEQLSKSVTETVATNPPARDVQSGYPKTGTVKVGTSLNIRTTPWGAIIGSLYDGNQVQIIGREGAWYKISHNGQTAYVHANYVDAPGAPAGNTPVVPPGSANATAAPGATPSGPPATGSGRFGSASPCTPMPRSISSPFGWRTHPTLGTRRHHDGVDLPVPTGTRLNALGDGVVTDVGFSSGGGKHIKVRYDNGLESFYCHLQGATATKGQRVSMGQQIAVSDNTGEWTTGSHLHLEIRRNGQAINPRGLIPLP